MQLIGLIFIGLVAAGATFLSVTTTNNEIAIIAGVIGAVTWLLFAFFALDVTIVDDSGTISKVRYPALAAWGLMMMAPNAFVALTGPLQIISDTNPRQGEV
jgi:hypothetical protein